MTDNKKTVPAITDVEEHVGSLTYQDYMKTVDVHLVIADSLPISKETEENLLNPDNACAVEMDVGPPQKPIPSTSEENLLNPEKACSSGSKVDPPHKPIMDPKESMVAPSTTPKPSLRDIRVAKFIQRRQVESTKRGQKSKSKPEDIEWAEDVLKAAASFDPPVSDPLTVSAKKRILEKPQPSKRQRSSDDIIASTKKPKPGVGGASAKSKPSTSKKPSKTKTTYIDDAPISTILKEELKVCIVDTSSPDWKISVEHFNEVDDFLMIKLFDAIKSGRFNKQNLPKFSMKERYHGFRVITCDTPTAVSFLSETIGKMNQPWKDAKLDVKKLCELPSLPKVYIGIPAKNATNERITTILETSNPDIQFANWQLLSIAKPQQGRQVVVFRVDLESAAILKNRKTITWILRDLPVHIQSFVSLNEEIESEKNGSSDQAIAELLEETLKVTDGDDATAQS